MTSAPVRNAAAIRARRAALGLTQAALARKAGVSPRTIWSLEHGTGQPYPTTWGAIATVLGLDAATPDGRCAPGLGWPLTAPLEASRG